MKKFIFIYFVAGVLTIICCELGPVVYTDKGPVRGVADKTVWNKTYYSFWGIPYAKPPLNKLRFMPPQEVEGWDYIKNATKAKPSCPQYTSEGVKGRENCLYLNIFTPKLPTVNNTKKYLLPVMVWIHGGSFNVGSGYVKDQDPDFFMEENVIWVSFNYRLGILGFLSSRLLNVSGNAGMKDQVEVLKWVRRNIHKFGGDCEKVTLIGWSAGSASVHYHLMSPLSQGLFHKAILQSGTAINPWAFTNETEMISDLLCGDLFNDNCTDNTLKLLQKKSIAKLLEFSCHKYVYIYGIFPFSFVPSIDDTFLTDSPFNIIKNRELTQVPIIIGYNSNEGNVHHFESENNLILDLTLLNKIIPLICMSYNMNFSNKTFDEITSLILDRNAALNTDNLTYRLVQADSECVMVHGISESVNFFRKQYQSSNNEISNETIRTETSEIPIYFYQFSFDGLFNFYKLKDAVLSTPGASHGDELGYLFRNKTLDDEWYKRDSKELVTLKRMTKMWTNFAKTGNPTPEINELLTTKWLPVTLKTKYMLNIDDELTMMQNFNESMVDFYSQFYDF